jgi:hypothetical protein
LNFAKASSIGRVHYAESACQSVAAGIVDREVTRLALLALAPYALDVSLQVAADWQRERAQADAQWQQRLERAQYEADRARRQYHAVEPENRLVCRTLEAEWEQKLRAHRELQEEYERFLEGEPKLLSNAEQDAIRSLAADLPALWKTPTTTNEDRKSIGTHAHAVLGHAVHRYLARRQKRSHDLRQEFAPRGRILGAKVAEQVMVHRHATAQPTISDVVLTQPRHFASRADPFQRGEDPQRNEQPRIGLTAARRVLDRFDVNEPPRQIETPDGSPYQPRRMLSDKQLVERAPVQLHLISLRQAEPRPTYSQRRGGLTLSLSPADLQRSRLILTKQRRSHSRAILQLLEATPPN